MKSCFTVMLLCVVSFCVNAQKFHAPFTLPSVKDANITLTDGSTLKDMRIKKIKAKKGIAKSITVANEQTPKRKLKAEEIQSLQGKPKGLAKFSAATNTSITNIGKTDYGSLGKDALEYEQVTMPKKSKVKVTLLQVLNPEFDNNIKVYGDPLMKKSANWGGIAGGELKSFYLKAGDGAVIYVKNKAAYRKQFKEIYKSCPDFEAAVVAAFKDVNVMDLAKHVTLFDEKCAGQKVANVEAGGN